MFVLFFVKEKTAYEIEYGLVGSEMCIRDRGKCEDVSVSPTVRTDIHMDFDFKCNMELKAEIELWIKNQTFATNTIPKGFQKFKYSDFVYLK